MQDGGDRVRDYGPYVPGGEKEYRVQSIMATFESTHKAEKAADALKAAGYKDVQIERVATDPSVSSNLTAAPWPKTLTGVPGPERVLAAADPTISGMAAGYDLVTTQNVLLTVVIEQDRFDRAKEIIREHGGDY